ncbi:Crp/Fnr family transcriptional regulator [Mucilaginibacter celer]|uniref:Crp/Fnr family transcriptional regulator n=2 Tax=Mucilaginibacter celer TaxID=2305508 RepID=A0A494VX53_9SPHI|nr:Crp/Fnr family transcriptional regulator [Mucilaginibacter celer]
MFDHIFANFAYHIQLNADEQARIKNSLQTLAVKKNRLVLRAGEICRNIYFVDEGCLRMFYIDEDGFEHNILFQPENWWAVDIDSFSHQTPAFYNIGSLEDSMLHYLSHAALEKLYLEIPKLERFFRILTQNGFNLYQRRITSALSQTAEERFANFRQQYPRLESRIAQKHIAAYLGITPVFLSQLRRRRG